ncbi:MAG: cytochrome c peroxidase [Candidatus Melainabacteria bacterium]|nr:cytochrome c peroxidase [Candidatus Melainabacteria bacterium]
MCVKRVILITSVLMAMAAVGFPLWNLKEATEHPPAPIEAKRLTGKTESFKTVAKLFQTSCADCHSAMVRLPFYAQLPVAGSIIQQDMAAGLAAWDMDNTLLTPGQAPDAVTLSKIEHQITTGEMPPLRYVALHWNAALSEADQQAIVAWIAQERKQHHRSPAVAKGFETEPLQPIDPALAKAPWKAGPLAAEKIQLGFALYHDKRLSGDGTVSCASCHGLTTGGTDRQVVSTGIRGQKGGVNAPTVFNSRFNLRQFWDGRAADLKEQAAGPVTNPVEMGGDWKTILANLNADAAYKQQFQTAYQGLATQAHVTDAIARFEETLVTPNSAFDQYLMGEPQALSNSAKRGYRLFKTNGCATCHTGVAIGGQSFEKLGVKQDYFALRHRAPSEADRGRFNATKNEADRYRFKVPTLRNVALTAPYFHDGSAATLEEAVRVMAQVQLGKKLSQSDVEAIVAFLESLTGTYQGQPLAQYTQLTTPPRL